MIFRKTQILVDIFNNPNNVARCSINSYYPAQSLISFFCPIDLGEDVPLLGISKNKILGNATWKNGIEGEDFYYFFKCRARII